MGININNQCVVKEWIWKLSWKQQAALLSSLRGCDSVDKYDPSKKFVRKMRNVLLHNGAVEGAEFLTSDISDKDIYEFTKSMDKYPIHFVLHYIHSAEIIGYNHPDPEEREWWFNLYKEFVHAFHMNIETKEENDFRLRDGVETCCHKT